VADVKLRLAKNHNVNNKETSTYPDVMLACGEEVSDLYKENPLLLAENESCFYPTQLAFCLSELTRTQSISYSPHTVSLFHSNLFKFYCR
jgi:hypothetical protein